MAGHRYTHYPCRRCPELDGAAARHPVIIAGSGPVGLTAALELASQGIASLVLEDGDTVSEGSRALCWSKRSLEILDRHGVADAMLAKGYTWNAGRIYHGAREVYRFDLLPQGNQKHPAFTNLQQYYAEEYLLAAVARQPLIEVRWQSRVAAVEPSPTAVGVQVETPEGNYHTDADYLIAADGARSSVRRSLGLDFAGRVFEDHFLIADVTVEHELPSSDRRFWFHPPFHAGETALCHKQGDNQWRVDFQLGGHIDVEREKQPERVLARAKAMLGDYPMELTWVSIYTFQARRLARFRHGRVLFAGDAAHQVSPFGARGGNSGIEDAHNLAWKLALVIQGKAPERLLDSYHDERSQAADENIRITSGSTDFLTPKTTISRLFRDAVLDLAADFPFARALVNSGRLSTASLLTASPLTSPSDEFAGGIVPGAPCPNLPIAHRAPGGSADAPRRHLLDLIGGRFQGLYFLDRPADLTAEATAVLQRLATAQVPLQTLLVTRSPATGESAFPVLVDGDGSLTRAFAAAPDTFYLLRPDQYVAARWRRLDSGRLQQALERALGKPIPVEADA